VVKNKGGSGGKRTAKLVLAIVILLFFVISIFLVIKVLFPKLFERYAEKEAQDLEMREAELEAREKELEAKEQGSQSPNTGRGFFWPLFFLVLLVGIVGLVFFFMMRGMKKGFGGKTREEMERLAKDHVEKKGFVVRSWHSRMFRPVPEDNTSWFVAELCFDRVKPGVCPSRSRVYSVAISNKEPDFVFEDYPFMTAKCVMAELRDRNFGMKGVGLPHNKPRRDEPFEGLQRAKAEAEYEKLKEALKEGV